MQQIQIGACYANNKNVYLLVGFYYSRDVVYLYNIPVSSELGVTRYKSNALRNIITFTVTSNITHYIPITFAVTSNITRYIPI